MRFDWSLAAARPLAASLLLVAGCNARTPGSGGDAATTGEKPQGAPPSTSSARPEAAPAASRSSDVPPVADRAAFSPVTLETIQRAQHKITEGHAVGVNLQPYCEPEVQAPGGTSPVGEMAWPELRVTDYQPLHDLLSKHPSFIGVVPERKRRSIVVVFDPDFQDWASIQAQIPVSRRVPVELRPGCHTRQQRELAQQALEALRKEPAVASALHAWAPDASIAGFRVFVLPGDTATAALVAERLGSIANVWFSRPFGNH
ncbi:hypothetical protein ACMHYB_01455 [Sorangium sp. So ce1128]